MSTSAKKAPAKKATAAKSTPQVTADQPPTPEMLEAGVALSQGESYDPAFADGVQASAEAGTAGSTADLDSALEKVDGDVETEQGTGDVVVKADGERIPNVQKTTVPGVLPDGSDPATWDASSGPITPDMDAETRAKVIAATAQSLDLGQAVPPVVLVHAGTYSGGVTHGPAFDLGELDEEERVSIPLVLSVSAFYGGQPTLGLVVKTSPTGGENSFVPVTDELVLTEVGDYELTVETDQRYLRAEFAVGGVGPAVTFSLLEHTEQ